MSKKNKIYNKNKNFSSENSDKTQLTESQVSNMLEFANNYVHSINTLGTNAATPYLVNVALQHITNDIVSPKEKLIEDSFNDPINNQANLVSLMEYFELFDMPTKRIVHYLGELPSFDYTYHCINIKNKSEYNSPEYKEDYYRIKDFFANFDVKQQFQYITKQLIRQETGFYIFRDDAKQFVFQELPQQYCKITGKWEYGLLYDFYLQWFIQPGVDINCYPKSMKVMANNLFKKASERYNPAQPVGARNSVWSYWSHTDPTNGYWAFKFNPSNYSNVPYLAGMFPDDVLRPLMRKLQTDENMAAAQKVLVGLIPYLQNVKSGSVMNQFALSATELGKYLGLIKQGLASSIKVGGVPFSDIKGMNFPVSDKSMYSTYNTNTASVSGVTSRLITVTDRQTAAETEASKDIDSNIVKALYPQFENFLKYYINKITKKYKFEIKFEGTNFTTDREKRLETWHKNAALGIVLPQKLAAAIGMSPFELQDQMEEASESEFTKNLIGLMNLNTAQTQVTNAGRPSVSVDKEAESTERKLN